MTDTQPRKAWQPDAETDKYEMTIPDGLTCGDCRNFPRCAALVGAIEGNRVCDWAPHRFSPRPKGMPA